MKQDKSPQNDRFYNGLIIIVLVGMAIYKIKPYAIYAWSGARLEVIGCGIRIEEKGKAECLVGGR